MSADRAKQILDEIKEERAKGGKIRLATTLIVLLMFGVFGLSTYNKIQGFDDQALLVKLQEEAAQSVWPEVSKELDAVAQDAVPAIQEAFVEEAENLLPKLSEKLSTEAVVFQDNMNQRIKNSLDGELKSQMEAREDEFKGKVPSFAERARLARGSINKDGTNLLARGGGRRNVNANFHNEFIFQHSSSTELRPCRRVLHTHAHQHSRHIITLANVHTAHLTGAPHRGATGEPRAR